jgi:hypothetical protein
MKTTAFSALALLFVSGCSVFGGSDTDASPAPAPAGDAPAPVRPSDPPPPLAGTPQTSELDESFGVFVVSNAQPGGDGSRARPFATIAEGIAWAKDDGKRVYVCEGTFKESIVIADGVSMVGGLDCSVATWKLGTGRTRIEATSIPAVKVTNITKATRFAGFEVIAPDATNAGESSIALFAKGADLFTVDHSRIVAGNGANGEDGVNPPQKVNGRDVDGKLGRLSGPWCANGTCVSGTFPSAATGGDGGTNSCGGATGGMGGTGGIWIWQWSGAALRYMWFLYYGDTAKYGARNGDPGTGNAINGTDGASAKIAGTFTREGFAPANGTKGTNGSGGKSGSGGNGREPFDNANPPDGSIWYGIQGSGGGAGGCGGEAGSAGTGGGASVAVFVSEGAPAFVDSELVAKNGGAGGKGPVGSQPTPGGNGGPAILGAPSTAGQPGSAGGVAGVSGSGAGGPSVAVVVFGTTPSMEKTTLTVGQGGAGAPALTQGGRTIPASASGEATKTIAIAQ